MRTDLKLLNQQASNFAKAYVGHFAWSTLALVIFIVVAFITNLSLYHKGVISAWIALPTLSILSYFSYTPLHEAVHHNINGRHKHVKWLNNLCGYLMAPLIAIPFTSHRLEHMRHHAFTNQENKDPDFIMQGMKHSPWSVLIISLKFLWLQNSFFYTHKWHNSTLRQRVIYCLEIAISLGWRLAFVFWMGTFSALIVIVVGYLIGGIFTAYWFAYRPHSPHTEQQRYKNTASLIMPYWMKPFEWFWLGQNLHSIHHLFARVPFYHYHHLHEQIEPILRAHGTPIIGVYNRADI